MGEWQTAPLGELVEPERGISYGIVQPGAPAGDGIPIVRVSDIRNGRIATNDPLRVATDVEASFKRTRLRGGELLLTLVGTVGENAIVPEAMAGWNTARAVAVIPVRPEIGAYWISLVLRSPTIRSLINERVNTTVQVTLNLKDVVQLPVPLPPEEVRKAIIAIVGALEDKIELNRRMSETLEATARALFKSWFIDFDPVRARMDGRDSDLDESIAELFPSEFQGGDGGQVPAGWHMSELAEVASCVKGRSYKSEELQESDIALVTLKSFSRGGGYRSDGLKPYSGEYKPDQVVRPGELVMACTDVTQAAEVIGRPAIVQSTARYSKLVASLDIVIIRPIAPDISIAFLYCLLKNENFTSHAYAHTTGTTVLHLSKDAIPKYSFVRPPPSLCERFSEVARPIFDRIDSLARNTEVLVTLRDTLLPKLISGELRIKDAERFVAAAV